MTLEVTTTLENLEKSLRSLLRGEHSSLTLSFNDHACNYVTVKEAVESNCMLEHGTWVSDEEKRRAIESNSLWSLHWYPDTPIGCYDLMGSSLESVVMAAMEVDE